MEVSPVAYRYALVIYFLFAIFGWYTAYETGLFLAQYVFPESASGFSVANPDFPLWNKVIATVLSVVFVFILFANEKLKEYVVDVGDEMTRVSWTSMNEAQKSTGVVIVLVVISGFFLFAADFLFLKIVNYIIGTAA
jgi:preprotein translocase SecE subunit